MAIEKTFLVSPKEAHKRIDQYLASHLPLSRTSIQRLIKEHLIKVNKNVVKQNYKLQPHDEIEVLIPAPSPVPLEPEPIPLDIIYEDEYLLVINKPAGLVVHPAPGHERGTLVNALLYYCSDLKGIGGRERPGIVHRLDKDTSGILVVAKQDSIHRELSRQFKSHAITRVYVAIVKGIVKKNRDTIELPIGRDTRDRKRISSRTTRPKLAITHYRVVKRFESYTLLELRPETGRTHQLRVHLSYIHHPIMGDMVYGGKFSGKIKGLAITRMMLHALRLGFIHPATGEYKEFEAPIPEEMKILVEGNPF